MEIPRKKSYNDYDDDDGKWCELELIKQFCQDMPLKQ